jgi:hypothetical protein
MRAARNSGFFAAIGLLFRFAVSLGEAAAWRHQPVTLAMYD